MSTSDPKINTSKSARRIGFKLSLLASSVALTFGWQSPIFAASVSDTLALKGVAAPTCTISIAPDGAASTLSITTAGSQTVTVGTVTRTCNNAAGYTLSVTTANCTSGTAGAKLSDGATHTLNYSINADNTQPPDGTWDVTGLAASACTGQVARTVSGVVASDDTDLGVVFTGSTSLFPGTYQDTITVTMTTT